MTGVTRERLRSRAASLGPTGPVFVARTLALFAGVITALLSAAALGPEGRGALATFIVIQLFLAVIGGLGTGTGAYVLTGRGHLDAQMATGAVCGWSVLVLLVSAAGAFLLGFTGVLRTLGLTETLAVIALLAVGAASMYLTTALIQLGTGLGKTMFVAVGFASAPTLMMLLAVFLGVIRGDAYTFMAASAFSWSGAAAFLLRLLGATPRITGSAIGSLLQTGRPAALGEVSNALSYRLDILILGLLAGPAPVGIYSLAVQVLEPTWVVSTAAASGLLIQYRSTSLDQWRSLTRRAAKHVSLITLAAVFLAVAAMPIVVAVVGYGFADSSIAAVALAPGVVLLSMSKVLAAYQVASARLWIGTAIATGSLTLTTAADFLLIPILGATGAAIASTAGYGISLGLWLLAFRTYAGRTGRRDGLSAPG